ncbi:MAG: LamG domain-containing protein, partial [Saprospiraceae bacterium]|nr:LamG domain-containing protein [Saprospiraceae bacterium]
MKNITVSRLAALMMLLFVSGVAHAQTQPADPECVFQITGDIVPRGAFITYGSGLKMKSQTRRTKLTIGQTVVGSCFDPSFEMNFGYWAGFLVAPFPPFVSATQGELLDRIQISWAANPLGPFANGGFKIYRDGVYLAQVDKNTRNYNDFNVIAGRPYNYEVRGINAYGEGSGGKALGFQVPNGVVTGWVRTQNDNPVPNALVTLMPMQGFSAYFGTNDGAFATPDTSTNFNFLPLSDSPWSMTFWIKTDLATGDPVFFSITPQNFTIKALNSNGVAVNIGGATLSGNFETPANQWHHVMIGYSDGQYRLYLDGILKELNTGTAILQSEDMLIGDRASSDNWQGRLDELRIYHKRLDELDLPEIMEGTASSLTEGLKYYWKMDEEQGTKSFDVLNRTRLFFCGADFSNDRPPVRTSGMTNEEGYYRIESASYGTGITFLAEPMKFFYEHRALKFTRAESDYATLPDFSLTSKATLETWINSAGPDGIQTVLSKRWGGNNSFQLQLEPNGPDNDIIIKLNNQTHNFGSLDIGYHHLAFTIDSTGSSTLLTAYKDGDNIGSAAFPPVTGNWSDPTEPWVLGARRSGNIFLDNYGGLIDEVALYNSILSDSIINVHANASRDPQENGLRIYFAMDEGSGNRLNNSGSVLLDSIGRTFGTEWTIMSPNQETTPHEFAPSTRQVTLNPSITSVDQVDFTDRSTIPVFGFVRYKNTDCFAENVEILVNGESFSPRIFTDTTGKFVIDLEPGATVSLTPKFEDHEFVPAFWDITNILSPVAGIVFNDITVRKIEGIVAGGDCKASIIDANTVCIVKVRSLDGCFEENQVITNPDGEYNFPNLPPIKMTVAVSEHSDPVIKNAFQVQGGQQVDLTKEDTTVNFIYYAPPQVEINGLPFHDVCTSVIVLEQNIQYTMTISMKEFYLGVGCPLDTGNIRIINDVAGSVVDTVMSNTTLLNKFRAAIVNSSPPFFQNIQVVGKSINGNESSTVLQVLVTGLFAKSNTFTTQLPLPPTLVLRDPPGDGSYSYFEKGKTVCQTVGMTLEGTNGFGATGVIDIAPNVSFEVGPVSIEVGGVVGPEITRVSTLTKISDNSLEVCQSFSETITTSSSDLIVGPAYNVPFLNPPPGDGWIQGGDVFLGSGLNVDFGFADRVEFDTMICEGTASQVVSISPKNYGTTYMYTEYHIRNNVIRYLQAIADDPNTTPEKRDTCLTSILRWNTILNNNQAQINAAKFRRNVSFDSGVEYEYSETSDTTSSTSSGTVNSSVFDTDVSILAFGGGIGGGAILHIINENIRGSETGSSNSSSITTGFVLADDDPGDAFSIDIAMDSVYKTPVFRTVSGQSSCPWEPKTAHREGNSLEFRDGSGAIAVDVPSNEAAVFKFTLGNQSETNETWTYAFTAGPESNPHGARIYLNGAALDHPVLYAVPYGESIPITLTVERGPEEYIYDSLEVVFYSLCEDDRANALGILPD